MARPSRCVAPRRGAGIETWKPFWWVRRSFVAPRRGAWIETGNTEHVELTNYLVAPRRGAWIETVGDPRQVLRAVKVRTPQGCVD